LVCVHFGEFKIAGAAALPEVAIPQASGADDHTIRCVPRRTAKTLVILFLRFIRVVSLI
jgi:hypothetical protein